MTREEKEKKIERFGRSVRRIRLLINHLEKSHLESDATINKTEQRIFNLRMKALDLINPNHALSGKSNVDMVDYPSPLGERIAKPTWQC